MSKVLDDMEEEARRLGLIVSTERDGRNAFVYYNVRMDAEEEETVGLYQAYLVKLGAAGQDATGIIASTEVRCRAGKDEARIREMLAVEWAPQGSSRNDTAICIIWLSL